MRIQTITSINLHATHPKWTVGDANYVPAFCIHDVNIFDSYKDYYSFTTRLNHTDIIPIQNANSHTQTRVTFKWKRMSLKLYSARCVPERDKAEIRKSLHYSVAETHLRINTVAYFQR